VARPQKGGFRIIDAFSRTVRLGAGLKTGEEGAGTLTDEAMDRSIEALKICSQKMTRRGVTRALCIATEACRTASNGASFIARAEKETGLKLEVITSEKEAVLAVNGCAPLLDTSCEAAMVFDIGGGSTELVWLDLKPMRKSGGEPKIVAWTSLPFGVVTLAETYADRKPQSRTEELCLFEDMVKRVRTEIEKYTQADHQRGLYKTSRAHLIGNSGTVTTLAAVHLGLRSYDRSKVDGLWIDGGQLYDLVGRLSKMGVTERANIPSVGEDRADLLFPGCAILRAIQETWPSDRVRVADRGLREGILVELMEAADKEGQRSRRTRRGRRGGRRNQATRDNESTNSQKSNTTPGSQLPSDTKD
jgi:exopolyphosphatase/guanosine-5'-triphosphate,3'-diphosphate pyrophosphatase